MEILLGLLIFGAIRGILMTLPTAINSGLNSDLGRTVRDSINEKQRLKEMEREERLQRKIAEENRKKQLEKEEKILREKEGRTTVKIHCTVCNETYSRWSGATNCVRCGADERFIQFPTKR